MKNKFIYPYLLILLCGCQTHPPDTFSSYNTYCQTFSGKKKAIETNDGILTLEQAQTLALSNNPDYQSALQSVLAAKYRYYRSLSAYLPELNAAGSAVHTLSNSWNLKNPPSDVIPREFYFQGGLSLEGSYLIFDGLAREFGALASSREYRKKEADKVNLERLLIRAVAFAYYDAVLAKEEERIAEADLSFQQSSLKQANVRYRYGRVSKASVLNFKIQVNTARSMIYNAQYRGKTARDALCSLMGFPELSLDTRIRLSPLILLPGKTLLDLNACLDTAVANRPDLRGARFLLESAIYQYRASWAGFMPQIRAVIGLSWLSNESRYSGLDYRHAYYETGAFYYGIRAEWNLFQGFENWNRIREQKILQRLRFFQLEQTFLTVVNEVRDAYANYRNQLKQTELFREMLQWVKEQRDLVQAEYWAGHNTITRLNEAQSNLVNAQAKLAISTVELNKSVIQLNAAVGMNLHADYRGPSSGTPIEWLLEKMAENQ